MPVFPYLKTFYCIFSRIHIYKSVNIFPAQWVIGLICRISFRAWKYFHIHSPCINEYCKKKLHLVIIELCVFYINFNCFLSISPSKREQNETNLHSLQFIWFCGFIEAIYFYGDKTCNEKRNSIALVSNLLNLKILVNFSFNAILCDTCVDAWSNEQWTLLNRQTVHKL